MTTTLPAEKNRNLMYYIHSVITMVLMIFFGFIPSPFEGITQVGMSVLGIFIGLLWGWVFVGFIWPSLISFICLAFTGTMTFNETLISGFGNTMYLMLFFLFILTGYFNQAGLTRYIANYFVSRKICIGKPWVLTTMIFISAVVLTVTVSYIVGGLMLWGILYNIFNIYNFKKGGAYVTYMIGGVMHIGTLCVVLFPFTSYGIIIQGLLMKGLPNIEIPVLSWIVYNLVFTILFIVLYLAADGYR